jgi:hypothetical protein
VRLDVEVWILEVGDLGLDAVELGDGCVAHGAGEGSAAPLVDTQQGWQFLESRQFDRCSSPDAATELVVV